MKSSKNSKAKDSEKQYSGNRNAVVTKSAFFLIGLANPLTDTSEHVRFLLFTFVSGFYFLVVGSVR